MIVYCLTNTVTGKVYIGQTSKPLNARMSLHKYDANAGMKKSIATAIREFGWDRFDVEILYRGVSKEDILEKEKHFIAMYKSNDPEYGYNQTIGGMGSNGYTHSPEIRAKLKELSVPRYGPDNPNYGHRWTPEMKEEVSRRNKGKSMGDANPSKRADVRKALSDTKMGEKNPNACWWTLYYPDDEGYSFCGGVKRELAAVGLDYQTIWTKHGGSYNGWELIKHGED